jgi:hypothetical protein
MMMLEGNKKKKLRDNNKQRKKKLKNNKKLLKKRSKQRLQEVQAPQRSELRKKNPQSKHKSQAGE